MAGGVVGGNRLPGSIGNLGMLRIRIVEMLSSGRRNLNSMLVCQMLGSTSQRNQSRACAESRLCPPRGNAADGGLIDTRFLGKVSLAKTLGL